jgi:hypothetical protein
VSTAPDEHTTCDRCQTHAAELLAHYPGIRPRPPRWCPACAGPALADFARQGAGWPTFASGPPTTVTSPSSPALGMGLSTTNCAEHIWTALADRLEHPVVVLEHYPARQGLKP